MSKSASKERFLQDGVPTLPYVLFSTADPAADVASRLGPLRFPLVIKPDSQGSSLGVSVAHHLDELETCLRECRRFDDYAILEPYVHGREFTVAVLDREALPLLEILTPGLFDYEAKYSSPDTQYCFQTGLAAAQTAAIEQIAVEAAACLNTKGLCRVDLMLDGAGQPWVLEVNTVPGMTSHSLAPLAARQAGLEMPQLCELLVGKCLKEEVTR
jgi:D-alanine-D-alanine ligase